jgi:hypothetical protein
LGLSQFLLVFCYLFSDSIYESEKKSILATPLS